MRHRVVLIPETTKNLLRYWIAKNNYENDDFIFIHNNKPVRQEYAETEFRRTLIKAGIMTEGRKITAHGLRYTYVTGTRRLVDTSTTMLMAGHKSEAMTNLYTRFELEETVKKLEPLKKKVDTFLSEEIVLDESKRLLWHCKEHLKSCLLLIDL